MSMVQVGRLELIWARLRTAAQFAALSGSCGGCPTFENTYRHPRGQYYTSEAREIAAKRPRDTLNVRALKRLPLGTSYVAQGEMIAALLADPRLAGAGVFLDATGCGKPVSDLIARAVKHTPIWISAGRDELRHGDGYSVPKLTLISRLQAALHSGELRIARALPEAAAFCKETSGIQGELVESGHLSLNARQGCHDDMIIACALATWGATRPRLATSLTGIGWAV